MTIEDKIFKNIVKQLTLARKIGDLRKQLDDAEKENISTVGSMTTLAEFFKEQTGSDLQQTINTDPQWRDMLQKAEKQAEKEYIATKSNDLTNSAQAPQVVEETTSAPKAPQLRRVNENKKVQVDPVRSRPPVNVVIDDDPPQPQDGDDDSD